MMRAIDGRLLLMNVVGMMGTLVGRFVPTMMGMAMWLLLHCLTFVRHFGHEATVAVGVSVVLDDLQAFSNILFSCLTSSAIQSQFISLGYGQKYVSTKLGPPITSFSPPTIFFPMP